MKKRICLLVVAMFLQWPAKAQPRPESKKPSQHFVCNTGYTMTRCHEEMMVLRRALANYPATDLGEWTWVLVRSEDWRQMLSARGLKSGVPALTFLEGRTTFFEEVLVAGDGVRMSELMDIWHLGREGLLDLAIRHELGHALSNDVDERNADRIARVLEQQKTSHGTTQTARLGSQE
jgi:hypothetical protein